MPAAMSAARAVTVLCRGGPVAGTTAAGATTAPTPATSATPGTAFGSGAVIAAFRSVARIVAGLVAFLFVPLEVGLGAFG